MTRSLLAALIGVAMGGVSAQPQTPDTARYTIMMAKGPSGVVKAWTERDGTRAFHMEFNDRGRGPSLTERVRVGQDGYPLSIDVDGVDYYKAPVSERFIVEQSGRVRHARWRNEAESTTVVLTRPAFYLAMNDASIGILEPLLLASRSHQVTLLPQGEAQAERIRDLPLRNGATTRRATLYALNGLGFAPTTWWADDQGPFLAAGGSWFMIIRDGSEWAMPALLEAQAQYDSARGAELAQRLIRVPSRPTIFRNANLFDADSATMRPHMTVVVTGNRITAVGADGVVALPRDATVIEVGGKTLMPGLWDMHVHTSDDDGLQDLAAGVTTVRDMGNDVEETLVRKRRWEAGTLIGPRLLLAGFIDGPGPFAGPTKVLVSTPDSARAWVNRYADLGYQQIKVYSSLDTALVPIIIAEAHRRGLRVSGHVPNRMTAEEFVRDGADEIQHVNFLFLDFWRDSVKDTRTPERFTVPAERAALLDLQSERVQSFVRLLHDRHTVIDPTIVTFESMLLGRPGKMDPGTAEVADRLPPTIRRGLSAGGGLPVPDSLDQRYRESFVAFGKMVKTMYDGGVTIVAGTDGFSGFGLHRELELYAAAGIPEPEVLRIATIGAARVMHRDAELGSIAPGKLADLIIVDGHPEHHMADIRRVTFVMKDGRTYDPRALYGAAGVQPAVP
jgi:imidazolonepropionase-like amidohydrolase